jgi:heavy metal sensor kinase
MIPYPHSLAGRLTFWYATIFSLCFLVVFGVFYLIMNHHFHRWTDTQLKEEVIETNMAYDANGRAGVIQQFRQEEASEGERFMGRIVSAEGKVVFEVVPDRWAGVAVNDSLAQETRSEHHQIELLEFDGDHIVRVIYSRLPDGALIQIGLALLDHELWMRQFASNLAKVALLTLLVSVCACWFMTRKALDPVREMARTAASVSGRSLGQRVPLSGRGDEVDRLAQAFNGMLERIDTLVGGLREVTDTLAHDLRTPIAGIRGMAEVTIRIQRDPETYRLALYQIIEQMDRLLAMFNSILDVAEAESGALVLRNEEVSIADLANQTVQVFEPVALDKGIDLQPSITPGLTVKGDRGRLSQVLANLLDNALKYTLPGGQILLSAHPDREGKGLCITVTDSGIGISEKDLPHIFERYYRGDRSRSGPGVGLGLPLVQGIVKAHGGTITVESQPQKGTTFRLLLPIDGNS